MKSLLVCLFLMSIGLNSMASAGEIKSSILSETCPAELSKAISFVLERIEAQNEGTFVAILPENIGYQYFKVEFRAVEKSIALPGTKIEFEFEYWVEGEEGKPLECTRIEPMDYIY